MARPILFGVAIIIAVYLPILTLQGLEGRMFRPMAITVCSALLGSLVLALTAVPALSALVFRRPLRPHRERIFGAVKRGYLRVLPLLLDHRLMTAVATLIVVAVALGSVAWIGTEFMPRLDEGSILIETRKLPSVSLSESVAISMRAGPSVAARSAAAGVSPASTSSSSSSCRLNPA